MKLILKDGTEIVGQSFGYKSDDPDSFTDGEVVFNTSMVGYPETFTDPSYAGQILVLTYPLIGNYGMPPACHSDPVEESLIHKVRKQKRDSYTSIGMTKGSISSYLESNKIHLRGIIVSEYSNEYSHWQAKNSLADFLKKYKIPAIQNVDTRALTQKLREHGVMLGKIVPENIKYNKSMIFSDPNENNLVASVSIQKKEILPPPGKPKCTVALIDCGIKHNIIRNFLNRGCKIIRLPWDYDIKKLQGEYDGLFISNGPGDPKTVLKTTEPIKYVMNEEKPIFGICLGTQLMALSVGADTYKLKYGHRSANQPCINLETGKCYITSQNHGYAVDPKTLSKEWKVWFENANDGTVEGIKHNKKPWFAVQFHPEASPGPEDAAYLFDEFINIVSSASVGHKKANL